LKLLSLEKYLLKNDINDEEFKKLVIEISEKLELEAFPEDRKLTDEEIDYEYVDFLIAETLETLKDDVCKCEVECGVPDCCGTRVEKNLKKVYEMALYMLRDGISYEDLTQEGIIGLIKAHELFEDDKDFKLYKDYYIAKEMFNYINNYANYRKSAFKDYAEHEIHKDSHLKVSLKDKDKSEELKKLEKDGYLAVEGTLPDGETSLVLWRDCEKVGYESLDALLGRLKINPQDSEYDTVYINGDHNIATVWENENGVSGRLKIRQIESEFMALMFGEAQ